MSDRVLDLRSLLTDLHKTQRIRQEDVNMLLGSTRTREQAVMHPLTYSGQHRDPTAQNIGYQAIINTLIHLGLIAGEPPQAVAERQSLRLYEVIDRNHAADSFVRLWESFDEVKAGTLIGTRATGEIVVADQDGRIVFPNPNALPGQEWFYLAKPTARMDG